MKERARFKVAQEIKNPVLLNKIHGHFRLTYIKDVVLPRVLDDINFAALANLLHNVSHTIVDGLLDEPHILDAVFEQAPKDFQALLFLKELVTMSKYMQPMERQRLHDERLKRNFFAVLIPYLTSNKPADDFGDYLAAMKERTCAMDSLLITVQQAP